MIPLDAHLPRRAGAVRLRVLRWLDLGPLQTRCPLPTTSRRLLGYLGKVGARRALKKIASRRADPRLSLAIGAGVEPGSDQIALFLAARVSTPTPYLVVARAHTAPWPNAPVSFLEPGPPKLLEPTAPAPAALFAHAGYSIWSGQSAVPLSSAQIEGAQRLLASARAIGAITAPIRAVPRERARPPAPAARAKPRAILFGYGHYARTCLLPSIERHLRVDHVHELEPSLSALRGKRGWDTSPGPRPDEPEAAAWLIAGYHHHHARLAAEAIGRGAAALIEKPLATTRTDLEALLRAVEEERGHVFVGMHRRYAAYDEWLRSDLRLGDGRPCDLHAVVREPPLPAHHWYRWPAGGGILIMNGCHWIDQFLWLNDFSPVRRAAARSWRGGGAEASIELENGAVLTLAISSHGSPRLGVREITEFRSGERSARLIDWRYASEDARGALRRARVDEADTYRRTYDRLGRAIVDAESGEPVEQLRLVWSTLFSLSQKNS